MRQETFTILFLMRKGRPKKNGLASVYARITTGSLRQEFYFHCEGKPEMWNQHKEHATGTNKLAIQINKRLDNFRVKIIGIRSKLLDEVGVRITQRTADKYGRLLRYLKQYLAQRGKAEDIPVERMNYEFLDGFNLFLQTATAAATTGRSP